MREALAKLGFIWSSLEESQPTRAAILETPGQQQLFPIAENAGDTQDGQPINYGPSSGSVESAKQNGSHPGPKASSRAGSISGLQPIYPDTTSPEVTQMGNNDISVPRRDPNKGVLRPDPGDKASEAGSALSVPVHELRAALQIHSDTASKAGSEVSTAPSVIDRLNLALGLRDKDPI